MAGSAVAMMVESRFSMNSAEATISGIRRIGLPPSGVAGSGGGESASIGAIVGAVGGAVGGACGWLMSACGGGCAV